MVNYAVEYKKMISPYSYEYYRSANGSPKIFKSISEARKACISLISSRKAVLAVVRGNNKEQLVYATVGGGYVLEDRQGSRSYWHRLNKNGTLGNAVYGDTKSMGIIQSASQRW